MKTVEKVVGIGIGLTVLFLLLSSIIMPYYATTGQNANLTAQEYNASGAPVGIRHLMSTTTFQGILVLVFVLAIVGIAMAFFKHN